MLIFIVPHIGCGGMQIVSVDQKTQLENQILGSMDSLQGDLALMASVRGDQAETAKIPPAHKEALLAMMNRQFNQDDVNELKARVIAGENINGLLTFFETALTKNDPNYRAFAKRIVKEENQDRLIIMQRVISINKNLSRKDLPTIRMMMYKLNAQSSAAGTKVQSLSGKWNVKQGRISD